MTAADRVECLEEALREIVIMLSEDGHHVCCERDAAALAVALDQLACCLVVLSPHPA